MLNLDMLDPGLMAFFKQAGQAYQELRVAESQGKLNKALQKYCGDTIPQSPLDPNFVERCTLYAAKAYATSHIEGTVTWKEMRALLASSSAWPPAPTLNAEGHLFLSYMLGFLIGSDLPPDKHAKIEQMMPMAAQVAGNPQAFAQQLGLTPDKIAQLAQDPRVRDLMGRFGGGKGE